MLYIILFYGTILYLLSISHQLYDTAASGYIIIYVLVIWSLYYILVGYYGINQIIPKLKQKMKLNEKDNFYPKQSILTKNIDSGRGYSMFIEFYPILKNTKEQYTITEKKDQYKISYDPNSNDLIIYLNSNKIGFYPYDNTFTIPNMPLQKTNQLFLSINQEIVTVYMNNKKYIFRMSNIPTITTSNIYVGDNNGLYGDVTRYTYVPFPISNVHMSEILYALKLTNNYILGFIPYL